MIRLARDLWPTWCPDRPLPADDGALVRGVLDAIALEHSTAPELLDECRTELARIEAFCREQDLIGLVDEPLDIRWTPLFLRTFAQAMLDSPGPLDKGQASFFAITPIPDDLSPEQAESYLREGNNRALRLVPIHEAVPGHYLQGAYANRCPSLVRAVFWSGLFAEGWAVSCLGHGGQPLLPGLRVRNSRRFAPEAKPALELESDITYLIGSRCGVA